MRARLAAAAAVVGLTMLLTTCSSSATSQGADLGAFTKSLVHELSAHYEVANGYPTLYTQADCKYTYAVLRNCMGNNPAAPYIVPVVRMWPNEYSDPAMKDAFGHTRQGYGATYRLDPREAIVLFGTLPPAGRYVSVQTYVATQEGSFDESSAAYRYLARLPSVLGTFFGKVPKDPSRVESFSSVGNSINNVVIDRQSGASFGTRRFFIITPDANMDEAVRSALGRLGVPSADIFTEAVPSGGSSGVRIGLGRSADDFITLMRYALPDNARAGDQWRAKLPLSVLRVRERPSSPRAAQPYAMTAYDARSAAPEKKYAADLNALEGAVCQRWGGCGQPTPVYDVQAPPLSQIGPTCRQIGMNCLADGQDSSYFFSAGLSLDHGEIYAVMDTLATETDNATYVSLGVTESSKLLGVASVEDPALEGSARSYAPAVGSTGKLFVYYLTRNCSGLGRLTEGRCLSITSDMVPPGQTFKISVRDYVRPGTARGPESSQLLKPVVVQVKGPSS